MKSRSLSPVSLSFPLPERGWLSSLEGQVFRSTFHSEKDLVSRRQTDDDSFVVLSIEIPSRRS